MNDVAAPASGFERASKRSVTIAGHETSVALEPVFWRALEAAAARRGLPLNALVAQLDALRIHDARPPNLASAVRTWLMAEALAALRDTSSADMQMARNIVDSANDSQ